MRQTKENVLKVLRKVHENRISVAQIYKDSDKEMYNTQMLEAGEIETAIKLLTDKDFFDFMVENYKVKEG